MTATADKGNAASRDSPSNARQLGGAEAGPAPGSDGGRGPVRRAPSLAPEGRGPLEGAEAPMGGPGAPPAGPQEPERARSSAARILGEVCTGSNWKSGWRSRTSRSAFTASSVSPRAT